MNIQGQFPLGWTGLISLPAIITIRERNISSPSKVSLSPFVMVCVCVIRTLTTRFALWTHFGCTVLYSEAQTVDIQQMSGIYLVQAVEDMPGSMSVSKGMQFQGGVLFIFTFST